MRNELISLRVARNESGRTENGSETRAGRLEVNKKSSLLISLRSDASKEPVCDGRVRDTPKTPSELEELQEAPREFGSDRGDSQTLIEGSEGES